MQPFNHKSGFQFNDLVSRSSASCGGIVPAILAVLVLQYFRIDQHRSLALMYSEIAFIATVTVSLCFFINNRVAKNREHLNQIRAICISQLGTVVIIAAFLTWQFIARRFGLGDANEIVVLVALQYLAFFLALIDFVPGYDRASLVLSGALVFFVCCMTQRFEIFVLASAFTVIALWNLLGLYWSRVDSKAIDGQSKLLSIHGSSIALASMLMLLGVGLASLIPMSDAATALQGYMPFSGGEDGYEDEFARDGIGDGEMLTGGNNATTTGPVDTDQFIEDHKPSLYDVLSEKYDGPIVKKRRNRAVPLDAVAKHLHDLKQSEMAGKTFRTMRKAGKPADKKVENRITDALFFVEGSVPARFAITHFQHFDGWDWTSIKSNSATPKPPRISLTKQQSGKFVFALARPRKTYLPGSRIHRLKIMRLESSSLPMVSVLDSWHIPHVNQASFFNWDDHGQIQFDGDLIPSQTVIDMKSLAPNYHIMRDRQNWRRRQGSSHPLIQNSNATSRPEEFGSPYLQLPSGVPPAHKRVTLDGASTKTDHSAGGDREHSKQPSIDSLVDQWIEGIDSDWKRVESIVRHVRNDFALNDAWQADPTVTSSVEQFIEQRGGPGYIFATACAMALRTAGYKTRLASGFIVREDDFDRVSKQSVVSGDSFHMWPEVCLDDRIWIAVEPTPGYPNPYSVETVWQRFVVAVFSLLGWIYRHPLLTVAVLPLATLTIAFRLRLVTVGLWWWWHAVRLCWPRGLLSATRRLIDARFWAAGIARPTSQTIVRWYAQVEPNLPGKFFELWNAQNFSESTPRAGNDILIASCHEQVQLLTFRKIRRHTYKMEMVKVDDL